MAQRREIATAGVSQGSAGFQPAVSRISNPLTFGNPGVTESSNTCRMEFGDTADWKSALRRMPTGTRRANPEGIQSSSPVVARNELPWVGPKRSSTLTGLDRRSRREPEAPPKIPPVVKPKYRHVSQWLVELVIPVRRSLMAKVGQHSPDWPWAEAMKTTSTQITALRLKRRAGFAVEDASPMAGAWHSDGK
jgi:hypothetical protein